MPRLKVCQLNVPMLDMYIDHFGKNSDGTLFIANPKKSLT